MKDPHGRIARWFTLFVEYDFEICHRPGKDNASAYLLSRPVELMITDENQSFEANFEAIEHFLDNISVVEESISITPELKKKAKDVLVDDGRLFRRPKYGIWFLPHIQMRQRMLKGLHEEVGYWDFHSTFSFARDRFWWPNMRKEVASFVKCCDICQKTKPADRKELAGKIPSNGLFHTWCMEFAELLPRTNVGNQYLIVAVEQISK